MSPYGSYDEVIDILSAALQPGPHLLGSTVSAADILWGSALSWTMAFKLVPRRPELTAYAARIAKRPAVARGRAKDDGLAAAQLQ